jgi:hypothetical protein
MIDVNKITSTLAKLPDQQLQQYAQMHKNDPYIMALAMSESNRRKEMRSAGQGEMQEQPKVVDQMVAEMAPQQLPEDMGIGQLPAGEMNFAGGGIVAFADGGDVERYQTGGSLMGEFSGFGGMSPEQAAAAELRAAEEARLKQLDDLQKKVVFLNSVGAPQAQEAQAQLSALKSSMGPTPSPTDANFRRKTDPRMAGIAATPAARPLITSDAAPTVGTGRNAPAAEPTDKAGTKLPGQADLATLYQDILSKQNFQDPAAEASLQLEAQERANAAAERQAIVRDAERFKDAYKGREARLAEREADIGKQKGTNTGLAFLNAGLAIMSTPGGLATAIGKGAQVGTAQFAAGLDKIRSAQERLGEARDRLDDLKLNREDVTAKDLRDAERKYREVAVNAQKRTIDGVRQAAGVNEARAKEIYGKTVSMAETVYKEGEANKRAAGANRNNQLELLRAVQSDPKLAAAYRAMHGKGEDVMGQYNDFLKANPTLAIDPQQAMTQFLMSKSVFSQLGTPTVTDKAAGPVRKQP